MSPVYTYSNLPLPLNRWNALPTTRMIDRVPAAVVPMLLQFLLSLLAWPARPTRD